MKAELNLKRVALMGLLLTAPITVLAGGGQAFKDQKAQETAPAQIHVRDWATIDVNGDHLISAAEMEAFLLKLRGTQEATTPADPHAGLNQAEKLYARMMYFIGTKPPAADVTAADAPGQWNHVEKLYWSLQPTEPGVFVTAGVGKFQWQLDNEARGALQTMASDRVLDSIEVGMHFKQAGKQQPSNRISIPGVAYTVEIPPAAKHQTVTQPGGLVEFKPANSAQGG